MAVDFYDDALALQTGPAATLVYLFRCCALASARATWGRAALMSCLVKVLAMCSALQRISMAGQPMLDLIQGPRPVQHRLPLCSLYSFRQLFHFSDGGVCGAAAGLSAVKSGSAVFLGP